MRRNSNERLGRIILSLSVALTATAVSIYLFAAGSRERFEPLQSAALAPPEGALAPEPGAPPDLPAETAGEEADAAPEPVVELVRLRRSVYVADYLKRAGLQIFQAQQWANAFRSASHASMMHQGHQLTLERDPETGDLRGLHYYIDDRVEVAEKALGNGVVLAVRQPVKYLVHPVSCAFEINADLEADGSRNHIPKSIIERLREVFGASKPRGSKRPASVKLIYQEEVSRDGVHKLVGDLQAAQFETDDKCLFAFGFRDEHGRPHLYDERGNALGPRVLRYPLSFEYISSGFSGSRYHPLLHVYRRHVGVDLVARYGTPVRAVADGRVEFAGWGGELGRCVRVRHEHGLESVYGHLSRVSPTARRDSYVTVGQVIGWVGSSGLATGPHLHFSLIKDGNYINPLTARLDRGGGISPRLRSVFEKLKRQYETMLSHIGHGARVPTAGAALAPGRHGPARGFARSADAVVPVADD